MADTLEVLNQCKELADTAFTEPTPAVSAEDAALYLAHTRRGETIRALASATGAHPSSVQRVVKKLEDRRDDPLMNRLLEILEHRTGTKPNGDLTMDEKPLKTAGAVMSSTDTTVRREAKRYLRRLSEPGSFLMIADGANRAGIFCAANLHRKPIAMLAAGLAVEFLRHDWIKMVRRGTVSARYVITDAGRSFLKRVLSEDGQTRRVHSGFAEAQTAFQQQHRADVSRIFSDPSTGDAREYSVNLGESPIGWLSRRKGPDGQAFLSPEEVEAAERLRCDFEAAQMSPAVAQDWRKFLTPGDKLAGTPLRSGPGEGPIGARDRVVKALGVLGPGLSDVAIRVCCFLEGLEACERRMGWSTRSGKVVLKIALQRLAEHYGFMPFKH